MLDRIEDIVECSIIKRVNRFVVEVLVKNCHAMAHINNTGRLSGYIVRGRKAYCVRNNPGRKTGYKLFAVSEEDLAVLIDTRMQMKAFEIAVYKNMIPWLKGCKIIRRNAKLGSSRIDYLFDCMGSRIYVEVKSAVLRGGKHYAMYPDCPTMRGRKHINEIINYVLNGGLGAIVFIAAMPYIKAFKPYERGDPEVPTLIRRAYEVGVMVKAISLYYDPQASAVFLDDPDLEVELY